MSVVCVNFNRNTTPLGCQFGPVDCMKPFHSLLSDVYSRSVSGPREVCVSGRPMDYV